MKWKEISKFDKYKFSDGSRVTDIHDVAKQHCYEFILKDGFFKRKSLVVSGDHYILCEIKNINNAWVDYIKEIQQERIPKLADLHVNFEEDEMKVSEEMVDYDYYHVKDNIYWLSAEVIHLLLMSDIKVKPVGNKFVKWNYVGERDCFCVSTNTGRYDVCGVTHHNSVTLRNVVFHSLTHSDDIKLAMIDLKLSEFARYKDMNNVVGVANTVREAAELLRLAREIMYARNQKNAERGLTDFKDYIPTDYTGKISIFGREFDENTEFEVEIAGEKKKMTAIEIFDYVQGEK